MTCKETVQLIPTYPLGPEDANPLFFEKRNVQGASGEVFPMTLNESISDEKKLLPHKVITLENEYLQVTLLPEQGGKIYRALDKNRNYDFVYYNRVIKPQLIGTCGPWASGGIEFNWPQHHRPTTFSPVEYAVTPHEDGSSTVWMGEVEPLNRTKGMVGVTVRPGRSYIQAQVRIYNGTGLPQSFMWWANLAVPVNSRYRAVFPPDIHWASDHAWAYTSTFPVIDGLYKGCDYAGADVRDYPNVKPSASFFTYDSQYDFLSGYDFGRDAGIVHVADRHVAPGKKMFTWGNSGFSKAWCEKLTDEDGPYIELMTGVYTCNQPDFSWIAPFECKTCEQYWYPIHGIGEVKNATVDAAMALDIQDGTARVGLNVTGTFRNMTLMVYADDKPVFSQTLSLTPDDAPVFAAALPAGTEAWQVKAVLCEESGRELVSYQPEKPHDVEVPAPFAPSPRPEKIDSVEDLYYHALHLYQYRNPFLEAEDYLAEALRRDPTDVRCNTLMGRILLHHSDPQAAVPYLTKAMEKICSRNPHPYECEPIYLLGIARYRMGEYDAAYEMLAKAMWDCRWKSACLTLLAILDLRARRYDAALTHSEEACRAQDDLNAGWIRALTLRVIGRRKEASALTEALVKQDPLNVLLLWERYFCEGGTRPAFDKPEYALDAACCYEQAGLFSDAISIMEDHMDDLPILYHMAYTYEEAGCGEKAEHFYRQAAETCPEGCLHKRWESLRVLRRAMKHEYDAVAPYLLGNILYSDKRFEEAIACYECAVARKADFASVYRTLALGLYEKRGEKERAGELMREAYRRKKNDPRFLYELCQYMRNTHEPLNERLALMRAREDLLLARDDAACLYISTLIEAGDTDAAFRVLGLHSFHSREGGEGACLTMHIAACLYAAAEHFRNGRYEEALAVCRRAARIEPNYHEGVASPDAVIAHIRYWEGRILEAMGDTDAARACYEKAMADTSLPGHGEMLFYAALAAGKLGRTDEMLPLLHKFEEDLAVREKEAGQYHHFERGMGASTPFELNKYEADMRYVRFHRALLLFARGHAVEGWRELDAYEALFSCDIRSKFLRRFGDLLGLGAKEDQI